MDKLERDVAPGEPAFIRRLPAGVEYTPIKTVFIDLPSGLPTLLWAAQAEASPLLRAFNDRSVRASDRALTSERPEVSSIIRHEMCNIAKEELDRDYRSEQALTIALMGLLAEESLIAQRLGRLGRKKPATTETPLAQ